MFNAVTVLVALSCSLLAGCQESPDFERYAFDAEEAVRRQEEAAESLSVGKELQIRISDVVILRAVLIPSGTFVMGSPESDVAREADEIPHVVTISKPFYMGVTEVTQSQWEAVMGTRPWEGSKYTRSGSRFPATCVNWEDAVKFCRKLSAKSGRKVRLPTEAEWEYACRAGTITAFCFGDIDGPVDDYAWWHRNANLGEEAYAREAGLKRPNAWGLHDMHGNVSEWCSDWSDSDENNYYKVSPRVDPPGPASPPPDGRFHVLRSGTWSSYAGRCRSAFRYGGGARSGNSDGFRIVVEVDKKNAKK